MADSFGLTRDDLIRTAQQRSALQNKMANLQPIKMGNLKLIPKGSLQMLQQQINAIPNPYINAYRAAAIKEARGEPQKLNTFQKGLSYLLAGSKGINALSNMYNKAKDTGLAREIGSWFGTDDGSQLWDNYTMDAINPDYLSAGFNTDLSWSDIVDQPDFTFGDTSWLDTLDNSWQGIDDASWGMM